ncbi:winged helix-turn-helix transcriptional regulator [Streptomyces globosus]|uniref:winged helix-turn-helix transcriptional regulator n=1 Tax=Streptomyces globosus TaxID=68209 RepID=UPI0037FE6481
MAQRTHLGDADCAIAQALDVVGDWWTLLIVRDTARGLHRFEELQRELGVSRKVLAERLRLLVEAGVLTREPYQERPVRHEYRLTPRGRGLLPVLVALQDWGDTWVLGDGEMTATTDEASREAARVNALKDTRLPEMLLPDRFGELRDPVDATRPFTVLYCFPGAYARADAYPPGWAGIPGAKGCTLESCAYRDQLAEFAAAGAAVHGVSTQRPDEQREFAEAEKLRFPLLSDAGLTLTTALRLPTFRAGQIRIKRLTLVVDRERTVREVLYPITDIEASVGAALAAVRAAA